MEGSDQISAKSRMIQLPELRLHLFSHLFNQQRQPQPDLLHAALVSRDFCENALSVLWEDVHLQSLFRLLMSNDRIIEDDAGSFHFVGPFDTDDLHRFQNYSRRIRTLRAKCTTANPTIPLFDAEFLITWTAFLNAAQLNLQDSLFPALRTIRWTPGPNRATLLACVLLLPTTAGTIVDLEIATGIDTQISGHTTAWCALLGALQSSAQMLKRLDLRRFFESPGLTAEVITLLCTVLPGLEVELLGLSESVINHAEVMRHIASSSRLKKLVFYTAREQQIPEQTKAQFPQGGFATVTHLVASVPCLNALFKPFDATFCNLTILQSGRNQDYFPLRQWREIYTLLQYVGAQCPLLERLEIRSQATGAMEIVPEGESAPSALQGCPKLSFLYLDFQTNRERDEAGCPPAFNPSDDVWLQVSKACPALESIHYTVRDPWYSQVINGDEAFHPQPKATLRSLLHILGNCPNLIMLRIPFVASGITVKDVPEHGFRKLKTLNVEQAWNAREVKPAKLAEILDRMLHAGFQWSELEEDPDEENRHVYPHEWNRGGYWKRVVTMVQSLRLARLRR